MCAFSIQKIHHSEAPLKADFPQLWKICPPGGAYVPRPWKIYPGTAYFPQLWKISPLGGRGRFSTVVENLSHRRPEQISTIVEIMPSNGADFPQLWKICPIGRRNFHDRGNLLWRHIFHGRGKCHPQGTKNPQPWKICAFAPLTDARFPLKHMFLACFL